MTSLVITDTQNKIIEVTNGPTLVLGKSQVTVVETGAAVAGADGANGQGVPTGGTTGQFLKKSSDTDYDTEWDTVSLSGYLTAANNLSDVSNNISAVANLMPTVAYSASGTHITITASGATVKPLVVKGASAQTGNLTEWQDSAGTALGSFGTTRFLGPNGSVVAGNGPGIAFQDYPTTGIGANHENIAIWERGTIALNLTNTLKEFRVPSDYYYSWASSTNNNSASDTKFSRASAGIIKLGVGSAYNALMCGCPTNATVGIDVYGAASQSANLQRWLNNTGTVQLAVGPTGQLKTNQTSSGTTLGSVTDKMPIYDEAGTLVGYVPIYDSIT